jgi:hypothetical protein
VLTTTIGRLHFGDVASLPRPDPALKKNYRFFTVEHIIYLNLKGNYKNYQYNVHIIFYRREVFLYQLHE